MVIATISTLVESGLISQILPPHWNRTSVQWLAVLIAHIRLRVDQEQGLHLHLINTSVSYCSIYMIAFTLGSSQLLSYPRSCLQFITAADRSQT